MGVDFLESRKIDVEIAIRHFVHTARVASDRKTMVPDPKGTVHVATFYGDPAFDGDQPLIVEGELDKLAVESAGNPFVVSVPDGAPPPSPDHKRTKRRAVATKLAKACEMVRHGAAVVGDRESRPPTWVGQRQRWCCSAAG
jgi:hypothetical protein